MKKLMIGFLAAAMAAALTGCQESGPKERGGQTAQEVQASQADSGESEKEPASQVSREEPENMEDVTVILDYVANTNHTGLYVALNQGFYQKEGLNVRIIEPTEGATATLIAVGKGDFGISYQEDVTVALASRDPLPVKAIATVIQHNTSGFATYADNNITTVKDFEGKTYAGWGGPGEAAVLEAVMTQAGADFSKLNMVISDGSGFAALKDQADIMWFYEAWDNVKCEQAGFPIHYMELRQLDSRLDYYTPVIIANTKALEENPEMAKKFMRATAKGYEYAMEKPEESAGILHKYAPDYPLEMLVQSQNYLAGKYQEDASRWGVMKDEVWDSYTDFMMEYGVIDKKVPASDCYTNEFLPD